MSSWLRPSERAQSNAAESCFAIFHHINLLQSVDTRKSFLWCSDLLAAINSSRENNRKIGREELLIASGESQ